MKENEKHLARKMRHARVRKKLKGSNERPRLAVFKSSKHIYAAEITVLFTFKSDRSFFDMSFPI